VSLLPSAATIKSGAHIFMVATDGRRLILKCLRDFNDASFIGSLTFIEELPLRNNQRLLSPTTFLRSQCLGYSRRRALNERDSSQREECHQVELAALRRAARVQRALRLKLSGCCATALPRQNQSPISRIFLKDF
jgi:hypothetical protein